MIVHDLYVVRVSVLPNEANSILIVDTDAVLTLSSPREFLEPIGRWAAKVVDGMCVTEHPQFSQSHRLDVAGQLPRELSIEHFLGFSIRERLDH